MKTISSSIVAFFIFSMLCLSVLSIHTSASEDFETKTENLDPRADAFVASYSPDENYGDYYNLWVRNSEYGSSDLIFIKFDLSRVPTEATIQSAQLKLHGGYSSTGVDVSAYYVRDDSWREYGLTYNNRPDISNTLTCTVENISSRSWYAWDITEDAIAAFHGDKVLTEALIWGNTAEYGGTHFCSRKSIWPPKLEITYTVPTTPTPTPSPTPTPFITPEPTLPPISTSLKEKAFAILKNPALAGLGAVGTVILVIFRTIRLYFKRKTKV